MPSRKSSPQRSPDDHPTLRQKRKCPQFTCDTCRAPCSPPPTRDLHADPRVPYRRSSPRILGRSPPPAPRPEQSPGPRPRSAQAKGPREPGRSRGEALPAADSLSPAHPATSQDSTTPETVEKLGREPPLRRRRRVGDPSGPTPRSSALRLATCRRPPGLGARPWKGLRRTHLPPLPVSATPTRLLPEA